MTHYTATPITTGRFRLGEAPFYDEITSKLSFVDIIAGKFYLMSGDVITEEYDLGQPLGAAVPTSKPGAYVFAARDGLYLYEAGRVQKLLDLSESFLRHQRSNDAKADPAGRLYLGSSNAEDGYEPSGDLFCYDGALRVLQPHTKIANGMAWSADRTEFYFADSMEHAVFAYDYEASTGAISNRKVLFTVEDGVPDGMCIDSEDNLWLAVWGGHRVECHRARDGALIAIIDVPAEHVTSCCFLGESGKLFITSSGEGLEGEYDGALFYCEVAAKGVPIDRVKL